jgi:hypothetical protein
MLPIWHADADYDVKIPYAIHIRVFSLPVIRRCVDGNPSAASIAPFRQLSKLQSLRIT